MVYITESDLDRRLQAAGCCAAVLANQTFKEFRLGMKCAYHNLDTLFVLNAYIEMMHCYIPVDNETVLESDNCFSEETAQGILEKIARICKDCEETFNHIYS